MAGPDPESLHKSVRDNLRENGRSAGAVLIGLGSAVYGLVSLDGLLVLFGLLLAAVFVAVLYGAAVLERQRIRSRPHE